MISFEQRLIPIKKLDDGSSLETNVVVVLNDKRDYGKINKKHLISIIQQKNISAQDNYDEIIRLIRILTRDRRLCYNLGGIETRDFGTDNFIIISYFNYEDKNYINGFIQVKDCVEYPNIIKTNYICTDLYFSGIGKQLLTFLKWILMNLKIPNLRINSINEYNTQNFYTSQGFYPVKNQTDLTSMWFEWNIYTRNKKDRNNISNLVIPFLSKYNTEKHKIYLNKTVPLTPYNKRRSKISSDTISSARSYSKIFKSVKSNSLKSNSLSSNSLKPKSVKSKSVKSKSVKSKTSRS
jgi:hypothetical protein